MKRSLNSNLCKVSFHDSNIESFERTSAGITITFDWAKIYDEESSLVIGKCHLNLNTVISEVISPERFTSDCLGSEFSLIGENSSSSEQQLTLGGFYDDSQDEYLWAEWSCAFDSFFLTWNHDVTHDEWLAGNLPSD
jgi:hypothetical protein